MAILLVIMYYGAVWRALSERELLEQIDAERLLEAFHALKRDLIRLQGAFACDALQGGRHDAKSLSSLIETTGKLVEGYEGSNTERFAEAIRACEGGPRLELILGAREDAGL